MPSLSNHARCQIDRSRNNTNLSTKLPFSRFKICPLTPTGFPLGFPIMIISYSLSLKSSTKLLQFQTPKDKGCHALWGKKDIFPYHQWVHLFAWYELSTFIYIYLSVDVSCGYGSVYSIAKIVHNRRGIYPFNKGLRIYGRGCTIPLLTR